MRSDIDRAGFHLGLLYRHAASSMHKALAESGVRLQHYCPRVQPGQPFDISAGVQAFTEQVKKSGELIVSSDFCTRTVYDSASDNHWFRFLHDMGHILYQCEFDTVGELLLHPLLWRWVETVPSFWSLTEAERKMCKLVYDADTSVQTYHHACTGKFPVDQREFVYDWVERNL